MIWLLVAGGGAVGSVARHGLNHLIRERHVAETFPLGIFLINVLGSGLIGIVAGALTSSRWTVSFEMRTFIVVGLIGGFTTFSSFSLDTFALIRDGHTIQAAWNVVGQVGLSLVAVALGYRVGSAL